MPEKAVSPELIADADARVETAAQAVEALVQKQVQTAPAETIAVENSDTALAEEPANSAISPQQISQSVESNLSQAQTTVGRAMQALQSLPAEVQQAANIDAALERYYTASNNANSVQATADAMIQMNTSIDIALASGQLDADTQARFYVSE